METPAIRANTGIKSVAVPNFSCFPLQFMNSEL
jgi:hypothetical protein